MVSDGNRDCTEPLGPWLLVSALLSFALQVLNCFLRPLGIQQAAEDDELGEESSLTSAGREQRPKKARLAAIPFFVVFCGAVGWFVCGNVWAFKAVHGGEDHCDTDLYESTFWCAHTCDATR